MVLACLGCLLGLLALVSCRSQLPVTSHTKDIATVDNSGKATFLYWHAANQLQRGRCLPDKPLLRHYCEQDIVSISWTKLSVQMLGGRDAILAQVVHDENELAKQLAAIDAELKLHPADADLSSVRAETAREFNKVQSQRLKLDAEVGLVNDFMNKLRTGSIVYRMVATEDRYQSQRVLLTKLNGLFTGNPSSPAPEPGPGPQAPNASKWTSIWTDPITGKVYIAVATSQSREYALATCRGISPGKWDAIGPFAPDMQEYGSLCPLSGTADDASRLASSPLASFLPHQSFNDGSKSIVVWSRCNADGNLPVVLRFDQNEPGLRTFVAESKRRFPVICEMINE